MKQLVVCFLFFVLFTFNFVHAIDDQTNEKSSNLTDVEEQRVRSNKEFEEKKIEVVDSNTPSNQLRKKVNPSDSVLPMLGGLLGVLSIILILAFCLKRFSRFNIVASHIKIVDSQSLGAKEKLVIVEIQDKQYVLGVTAHAINKICELEQSIEKKNNPISFDGMMKQFLTTTKKKDDLVDVSDSLSKEVKK